MWKISQKVNLDVKMRFWKSRIVITTTWTGYYLPYLCEKWIWPLVSLTLILSASYWPKFKSKVSFEILRTSRFQNWPYFSNLVKIWWRYFKKQKNQEIPWTTLYLCELSIHHLMHSSGLPAPWPLLCSLDTHISPSPVMQTNWAAWLTNS